MRRKQKISSKQFNLGLDYQNGKGPYTMQRLKAVRPNPATEKLFKSHEAKAVGLDHPITKQLDYTYVDQCCTDLYALEMEAREFQRNQAEPLKHNADLVGTSLSPNADRLRDLRLKLRTRQETWKLDVYRRSEKKEMQKRDEAATVHKSVPLLKDFDVAEQRIKQAETLQQEATQAAIARKGLKVYWQATDYEIVNAKIAVGLPEKIYRLTFYLSEINKLLIEMQKSGVPVNAYCLQGLELTGEEKAL